MATFKTDQVTNRVSFTPPGGGTVGVREAVFNFTAAVALNDLFQMIPVEIGERVIGGWLHMETDMDTATGITLDVGDSVLADRYLQASTIGQTGGVVAFGVATAAAAATYNYVYTAADAVTVKIKVAATSGAPTTGTIRLRALVVRG